MKARMGENISIKELKKICKPNYSNARFFEFYNPHMSPYIVKISVLLGIKANHLSLLMSLVALISIPFLASLNFNFHIIAVLLLLFSYLLDWSDGSLSKYYFFTSEANDEVINLKRKIGSILDSIYHVSYTASILLGFSIYYLTNKQPYFFYIGMVGLTSFLLNLFLRESLRLIMSHKNEIEKEILQKKQNHSSFSLSLKAINFMRGKGMNSYGSFKIYAPLPFILLNTQWLYLSVIAIVYCFISLLIILSIIKNTIHDRL